MSKRLGRGGSMAHLEGWLSLRLSTRPTSLLPGAMDHRRVVIVTRSRADGLSFHESSLFSETMGLDGHRKRLVKLGAMLASAATYTQGSLFCDVAGVGFAVRLGTNSPLARSPSLRRSRAQRY